MRPFVLGLLFALGCENPAASVRAFATSDLSCADVAVGKEREHYDTSVYVRGHEPPPPPRIFEASGCGVLATYSYESGVVERVTGPTKLMTDAEWLDQLVRDAGCVGQ